MNKTLHGEMTTEQHTYDIRINNCTYSVCVDVTVFVKPPDYDTWDSDYDYYGYTEVVRVRIINILTEDENGIETDVEFSQLSKQVQKEIDAALDVLALQ